MAESGGVAVTTDDRPKSVKALLGRQHFIC